MQKKSRERLVFESLLQDGEKSIAADRLAGALQRAGLRMDDPRLVDSLRKLEEAQGPKPVPRRVAYGDFARIVGPSILTVERALQGNMIVPDFEGFTSDVRGIFDEASNNTQGAVADYIPQLGRVDPEKFGLSLCTTDGQRHSRGDAREAFCLQSSVKPIIYALALEEHGESVVHQHMGCEPSGQSFNELMLNDQGRPHNPMINAGAIMSCSLIRRDLSVADRFDYVLDRWQELCGGIKPGFSNPTYLSERRTADRNFALGYFMREKGAFPEETDLLDTLEFYFQCCSLEVTTEMMSVVAATLANGGVSPLTGKRVLQPDTVQKCLSLMYSCGMYDFSGEWAFRVGLPAKSGVSGVIMVVVPNVMGLCTWAPRLDVHGNSVRGIQFCRDLVARFNFHNYDNLVGGLHGKKDPRAARNEHQRNLLVDLCWAASEGDVQGIRRLVVQGADLDATDYDGRTALHLAASEGRDEVVSYLQRQDVQSDPTDRWGNTPLDDAQRAGHAAVVELLEAKGARESAA